MNMLLLIIGMGVITYVTRVVPFFSLNINRLPVSVQQALQLIPYAALGALLLPGALRSPPDPWFGLLGLGIALLIAFTGGRFTAVICGTIGFLSFAAYFIY
ncbi:AzlD domain-containing protein [Marinococcus sp. PL1-022]|uniref:AzlD domain-containing protein n=1 Tax=Marinococcus sp. PL1-022 TaxID=3095363 RepID=UPI0029C26684|nr:AzlD domain-containing protein [Marinococcus sp. PL1-022]MDX6152138.1 AzlD domain-containing protein [Marinococcus sp. PL1-022]